MQIGLFKAIATQAYSQKQTLIGAYVKQRKKTQMVCEKQASNFNNSTNTHNKKKTLERALRGVRCNPAPTLKMPLCSITISTGNLHRLV